MRPYVHALTARSARGLGLLAIAVVAAALVGWGLGVVLADRLRPTGVEPALIWDDYVTVVAAEYAVDHDLDRAEQQLAVLGSPDLKASVLAVALAHTPTGPTAEADAKALRELAQALDPAVRLPEAQISQPRFDPEAWLRFLPLATLFAGLAFVALVAFRLQRTFPAFVVSASARVRDHGAKRSASALIPFPRARPPRDLGAIHVEVSYELGEPSFEQVVPVHHPATGKLLGGCGLGAGPKFSSFTMDAYYGLCVWLQDNTGSGATHSMIIASPWAYRERRAELHDWARRVGTNHIAVADGRDLPELKTPGLSAKLQLGVAEYGTDHAFPPESYFRRFRLRFGVTPRRPQ